MIRLRSKSIIIFSIICLFSIVFLPPKAISANQPLDGICGVTLIAENYDPGEFDTINTFLTDYGAQIAIVGPTATVLGEYGSSTETDFLINEMTNISDYDFIFLPGGGSPANLNEIPAALSLVIDAYNAGLVLAAICHGPWVFAEAGIISGRNISGNIGIQSYIVDAGANFISEGIVIDGPFVTADVAYMYDFAQQGILKGLGLFESDLPEILSIDVDIVTVNDKATVSFVIGVSDEYDTQKVIAELYKFNTQTQEFVKTRQGQLSRNENNTVYNGSIEFVELGNYSLWLRVEDVLGNNGDHEDVYRFLIEVNGGGNVGATKLTVIFLSSFTVIIMVLAINRRKRKKL